MMDIAQAKQQVKDAVTAYLALDGLGAPRLAASGQRPLFLLGAPGIGKTAIMSQVAHELGIGLVSYSMTHHTRQSALGLPFIVHKEYGSGEAFDVSEYTMSEIIASIYDYMEETGLDRGILFLDEINCVSETLYPSMLQFLQFKTFGRHRVPKGWVVVCAGNPPEYNRSVHEFDIVTLDRLRKVEIEPGLAAWRDYMRTIRSHPSVTTYLELRPDDFYVVESTPGGKSFVTARSWSELSDLLVLYEDLGLNVDRTVIGQYLQHEDVAARFSSYYGLFSKYRSDYRIEDVLSGHVPADISQRARDAAFDERLALMALMLDALESEARDVMERHDALASVREVLKRAEGCEGLALTDVLESAVHREETAAAGDADARSKRRAMQTTVLLKELQPAADYEEAAQLYREAVARFESSADGMRSKMDCAYDFVDNVFGMGSEALVFTTELAARRDLAQFVALFGCDGYFRHSAKLATDVERDAIFDEIDALNAEA
ncbi:AAA family ATPase [Slackia heliotrinireducens]|uniref:ATPase family protein associated with various cellular activities (AAA) n=2 Tax=Slackia TaxID=84108 RepID=C7N6U3_SLAHD|nr:AAA family ATPase [Slackia heliotrinireducens]ACV22628.1 ATPase family protein associated with various cellular activities (AAA) [Slackia heliotrinireducens DSM 20476]